MAGRAMIDASVKVGEAERMRRFIDYCESIGVRDEDKITLKSANIAGECEIFFKLGVLKHLVSME